MELVAADVFWLYAISLISLLIFDAFWIGLLAKEFYRKEMRPIIRRQTPALALFAASALLAFGLTYFALVPSVEAQDFRLGLLNGAILGFAGYSFYALMAYALVRGWSRQLAAVEIIWGAVVSIVTTGVAFIVFDLLFA